MLNRKIAVAAGIFGAVLVQAPAHAVDAQVIYKAHELDSLAGQKAVAERVRRNVGRACFQDYAGSYHLIRGCERALGAQIVNKIGNSNVIAFWKGGRTGQALASRSR